MTAAGATTQASAQAGAPSRPETTRLRPWRNPWRKPWLLESFTWLYLIWSLVPIALAILF